MGNRRFTRLTNGFSKKAERNLEMMWLTGRLTPDFKTIADFRKDIHQMKQPYIRGMR
jgi:transposase